tara:strand:- start:176 stop:667 length:492 start_codon:yes stop_codon:yes gene_type:complete
MKEIFKSPYTYIALFFIGRYYLKNKPDSTASKLIREVTEGGEQLLDQTTDFVTDSVDIVTETTEDLFGVVQEVGFNTQETLSEVVQGPDEALENLDGDTIPGDEAGDGSGFSGVGRSNMKNNTIDNELTYYDGQPTISDKLEASKFSFTSNVDSFSDNNPQMA